MKKKFTLLGIVYVLYAGLVFYVMLPALNWHSISFWRYLGLIGIPLAAFLIYNSLMIEGKLPPAYDLETIQLLKENGKSEYEIKKWLMEKQNNTPTKKKDRWRKIRKGCIGIMCFCIFFPIANAICTSRVFNAKSYAKRIDVEDVDFNEIPEVDFLKTPIIDRESSRRLGDKVMGNMTEWVSQFSVSNEYTQISYKDSVYRVTPLTYTNLIKFLKNSGSGIPAYITVDSTSGKTELVKLKDLGYDNMKYVPSAYWNKNLHRHLRFKYPTEIFYSPSFEIDENGHPWYICTTYTYEGVGTKKTVTGAILLDPITGDTTKYAINEIPEWIDRIYPEVLLVEELDDHGSLQDGFWNYKLSQTGVTVTSTGYNYLEKNGDIWLYSGLTSANSDASNLGFVLVNMRTHEAMRIASPGANEVSAMISAESQVKNYGYYSTFPLLINVDGHPVYLMSLKANGLVKMHAMVSATDYQQVAVIPSDKSLNVLLANMSALLGYDSKFISDELKEATITVKDLQQILMNGTTIYYILDSNDEKFKAVFQPEFEQALVFLTIGDELKVYYTDDGSFKSIQEIE